MAIRSDDVDMNPFGLREPDREVRAAHLELHRIPERSVPDHRDLRARHQAKLHQAMREFLFAVDAEHDRPRPGAERGERRFGWAHDWARDGGHDDAPPRPPSGVFSLSADEPSGSSIWSN